jgi:uncharacterized protein YlxW (UPF0749 family)
MTDYLGKDRVEKLRSCMNKQVKVLIVFMMTSFLLKAEEKTQWTVTEEIEDIKKQQRDPLLKQLDKAESDLKAIVAELSKELDESASPK